MDSVRLRYARLKFCKKLSSSNQSEVYLKFCYLDSICTPDDPTTRRKEYLVQHYQLNESQHELTFHLQLKNESFFEGLSFEHPVDFVRPTVPEIYLFNISLKNLGTLVRVKFQSEAPKCYNLDSICEIFLTFNIILRADNYLRESLLPMPWQRFSVWVFKYGFHYKIPERQNPRLFIFFKNFAYYKKNNKKMKLYKHINLFLLDNRWMLNLCLYPYTETRITYKLVYCHLGPRSTNNPKWLLKLFVS